MPFSLPRLYAILDLDVISARGLAPADLVRAWLDSGVRLIQVRAKSWAMGPLLELCERLREPVTTAAARLIVNDRADVARLAGAAGVHLGQEDLPVEDARRILEPGQIVGLSSHSRAQAQAAVETGADYIAIGPVFRTSTKANPDPVIGVAGVAEASDVARTAGRPLVAIGGITLATASSVIAAGADAVAVISDLCGEDWQTRAGRYVRALD